MIKPSYSFLLRHKIFLARVFIFWFAFLLVLHFLVDTTSAKFNFFFTTRAQSSFQKTLDSDLNHLVMEGNVVAASTLLKQEIKAKDSYGILKILAEQKTQRDIPLLSVTDAQGFVLTRADPTLPRNDNSFLSSVAGGRVSQGNSVSGYVYNETLTGTGQIIMSTGRPVYDSDTLIGSLFTSRFLDNAYSKQITTSNKVRGTNVAFYTQNHGIISSSFSDPKDITLLQRYFNTGTMWIENGKSDAIFNLNNKYYYLKNIQLPSTDQEAVGALLLVPIFVVGRMMFVIILLLVGAIITLTRVRSYVKIGKRSQAFVLCFASVTILISSILLCIHSYLILSKNSIPLYSPNGNNAIYNSTLRFSPDSGIFNANNDQIVSVILDTGGESINVVGLDIDYNPNEMEISSIDDSTSACDYIVEKSIDDIAGKITFSCALLHTLDHPQNTVIARLMIHPKTLGQSVLRFASSTTVKASDGLATDVLRMTTNASYTFLDKIETLVNQTETTGSLHKEIVYSTSHPNSERWYNKTSVRFMWTAEQNEKFRYSISTDTPDMLLQDIYTATTSNILGLRNVQDGLYYFNLAEEKNGQLGPITNYKFKVDITPPKDVQLIASQEEVSAGDMVRFMVTATDTASGLASGFYIKVDNHILYPVKNIAYIPFPEAGTYTITARVFDKANNYSDVTKVITVK